MNLAGFVTYLLYLITHFLILGVVGVIVALFGANKPQIKGWCMAAGFIVGMIVLIWLFSIANPLGISFGN